MRRTAKTGRVSEKVEQQHIVQLLRSIGAAVYVLGHPSPNDGRTHRGTGQTPGVPDLMAFMPEYGPLLFIEVKAKGGRLRPEQAAFRDYVVAHVGECAAHIVGGLDDVIEWLILHGWLKPENVPHYRRPEAAK